MAKPISVWIDGVLVPGKVAARLEVGVHTKKQAAAWRKVLTAGQGEYRGRSISLHPPKGVGTSEARKHVPGRDPLLSGNITHLLGVYR